MWVYRSEKKHRPPKDNKEAASGGRFVEIDFDPSYPVASTWTQRLASEPRIPLLDGFQFVTQAAAAEEHYKLKSVIFRHMFLLAPSKETNDSRQLRVLEAYKQLCTPPAGTTEEWPATRGGPRSPGPFQRSFLQFSLHSSSEESAAFCVRHGGRPFGWRRKRNLHSANSSHSRRMRMSARKRCARLENGSPSRSIAR